MSQGVTLYPKRKEKGLVQVIGRELNSVVGQITNTTVTEISQLSSVINLDNVDDGTTYKKLLATDISAGHINLTSSAIKTGNWYDASGVSIDAASGINIYGVANALTTRATKTGTIQCYVGADGVLYAGAGNILFNAIGLALKGNVLFLQNTDASNRGYLYGDTGHLHLDVVDGYPFWVVSPEGLSLSAGTDTNISLAAGGEVIATISSSKCLDMNIHKILNVIDPTSDQEVATKKYVDDQASGGFNLVQSQPARALDTIYQNTSGHTILVSVTVEFNQNVNGTRVTVQVASATPPVTVIASLGDYGQTALAWDSVVTFAVPSNYYYRVATVSGTPVLQYWTEWS